MKIKINGNIYGNELPAISKVFEGIVCVWCRRYDGFSCYISYESVKEEEEEEEGETFYKSIYFSCYEDVDMSVDDLYELQEMIVKHMKPIIGNLNSELDYKLLLNI